MNQVSQVAFEKLQYSIAGCSSVLSLGQCYKLDIDLQLSHKYLNPFLEILNQGTILSSSYWTVKERK